MQKIIRIIYVSISCPTETVTSLANSRQQLPSANVIVNKDERAVEKSTDILRNPDILWKLTMTNDQTSKRRETCRNWHWKIKQKCFLALKFKASMLTQTKLELHNFKPKVYVSFKTLKLILNF